MKLVQISDTHLTCRGDVTARDFAMITAFVNEVLRPDLVVNTGDIIALDPDAADDRAAAHRWHSALEAPVRVVPGNHDVGEPGAGPWMGLGVTSERIAAHREVWGDDRFLHLENDHAVIGLNSEVLGSGLPEERDQWAWLESARRSVGARLVLVMLHRPLWFPSGDRLTAAVVTALGNARERLFSLFAPGQIRAVGNGHRHRYRRLERRETLEVWAPSTGLLGEPKRAPDPLDGFEQPGVAEWVVEGDQVNVRYRAPVGLEERDMFDVPELAAMLEELRSRSAPAGTGGAQ